MFQCSSASRKFLNCRSRRPPTAVICPVSVLFSEPKIPQFPSSNQRIINPPDEFQCSSASRKFLNSTPLISTRGVERFQCSSASRKFLNVLDLHRVRLKRVRFSALQRAENSSIAAIVQQALTAQMFQCSSASRKFLNRDAGASLS